MNAQECHRQAAQLEALLQAMTAFPDPQVRAKTEALLQALLGMYGEGLTRLLTITAHSSTSGQNLIELFAKDELVSSLLLLHGLHPLELEARIKQALDEVRSSVPGQGGSLELLRVEHGIAYLRLAGGCQSCSASSHALRQRVEQAISAVAPDLGELRFVEEHSPQQAASRVTFVPRRKGKEEVSARGQGERRPDRAGIVGRGEDSVKL